MATRHELIHIDFVANAGKANPVLKSLQVSCNDARIAKEQLDAKLKDAKAMNAPAEVITNLEKKLKSQTTTWQQLERGLREYTKGIDTLSKGIKEFNDGTLDEMSAKFNKAVYNSAKLAQSAVKTGSSDWNQLQRLMDATDRNVTRAREDIDLMMQSLKDGSAVSTVQLTRSREVLEDLARLAVTNSEEWRGLRKQFNEVDAAIASVTETEKRLKGEIATENDAIALSNSLTKESIALRHADGEAAMKAAQAERKGVEEAMRGISDRIVLRTKERDTIQEEIEIQEDLDNIIKERGKEILSIQNRKQEAEQRKAQAQATIKEYDEQEKKVQELKLQKKDLEEQQKKETREAEKSVKATEEQNKKQAELTQTVSTLKGEIGGLETSLQGLEEQIKKTSAEPIKPKVDTSKIEELQAKLKAVQDGIAEKNAQIEAESKKGGLANKWQETLTRLQGDKDGRLSPMGLGDDKKQMDDILDVANNFYEIIKKVKGVTKDGFIPTPAAEPIKQLAEYYKITEEEARKLVKTLQQSEVVNKKFGTFDYNEMTGFLAINKNKGKDDQQIRIEAAQSYMKAAERSEGNLTEKVNKLLADKKKLEEEEVEIKGKLQAATEGVAEATVKSGEATEKKAKLTKKEQQEVKSLTEENESLTGAIDTLKKQLDSLPASQGKATEAAKKGAEAVKKEAEAMKMTAEEAKDALAKMHDVGTVKATKDGPLEASNLEGAQQALFGIFKGAGANVGNGNFTLTGQDQIRKAIKAFQDKFHIDDDKYAKELMMKLATGKNGGLIRQGVSDVDPITHKPLLQISRDEGAWKERLRLLQEYRDIQAGVTTATRQQTAADKAQEEVVKSLREAYQSEKDTLARRNEEYQKRLRQAESMSGSAKKEDGTLTAKGVELEKAEEYRQKYVVKQQEKERKAWEEYQAAKSGNIDVEKSRKQIEEQILTLEQQKAANTERLTQLQEKGVKATKEQVKAEGEAVTTGKNMNELLQEKERITARLTEKQAKLKKAQEDLAKMTKEETTASKEQSSVTEELTKKTEEYNAETEKLANMKEGRNKARGVIRNADRSISNADDAIATLKNEPLPQRKSESEMGAMKKRVAELTAEIEKETAAFNKNAQAITELNKKETQAAIEMAQSENVSIEKVKQSIELLQKKIQTEATDADTMKQRGEAINRLSERLTQMNAEVAKLSKPIADRLNTKNLGTLNETELQQSIDAAKQLLKTYKTGSDEAKQLADRIVNAEKYLKDTGIEAARAAQGIQLMQDQLSKGDALTESALKAQANYWQRLIDDPKTAADALEQYKQNLKTVGDLQDDLSKKQNVEQADRLLHRGYLNLSEDELQKAITGAREYQKTLQPTEDHYKTMSRLIIEAENHLKNYGMEALRAADKQAEADALMQRQLAQGTALTESALKAQVQYWQRLADDPKTAAEAVKQYTANMEQAQALLDKSRESDIREKAGRLQNMDSYSVSEIREGIDAAKKMQDTFKLTDVEVKQLSEDIVAAETRISKISVETERAARKEAQTIADMREQLNLGTSLTGSALKAQENYWRRLADQPGQAADKVREYTANMKEAQELQTQLVTDRGADTLQRAQNGEFATANMTDLSKAISEIKEYQALIKDPDGAGKETFGAAKEQVDVLTARLNTLKGVAEKVQGTFASADEVLARFNEHMNAGKTASEGMTSALDEKLSQATSSYDALIEENIKDVENYEQQIKEATQKLADMEKELAELEAKHKNSSWFRKQTKAYQREGWRIEDLRDEIKGHEVKMDDGSSYRTGQKQWIEDLQGWKQSAQGWVDYYKKQKAEELGITEEVEEKKQDAQRLTQEQMQEGIKLLEEEYRKTDHTTAEGIKRREQLRQTIDQMNQEIKESTGEWMSLAQAEELASKAGTSGFFATSQQMQQATQAIERQRDALVKTIQQKQRDGEATKKEEEELQRLEKVLKDLKFEQDNFNMSHKQMEDLLKHPKKADDLDQLKAAIKRADGELHRMKQSLGDNNDQYRKFAAEVKAAKNELKMMEGQAKATTGQLEKAWGRLKTYVGLYMGFNMAWQKFTGTIGDMKELSDRMGEVGKTTQMAAGEIARMTTNLSKMDTRTALTSLVELSAKAGQLGLKSREDVEGFTEAANKMLVALPEMGADGATQMMKVALATGEVSRIQKQMDEGLMEGSSATAVAMEKIASTIDQLRANSAAAAPQITDFVKRVGAVGAQSGISIDQVAALGSTVDALGMRVEMSATALSRMIPAIKNNAFDVAKAIGMAPEALRKMFDEAGGGMNAMLAIFQHIKDQGMNANDIEKMLGMGGMQEIMKELNQQGARAGIVFAGLSQNVDVLREHLSIAGKAYEENIAIQQEYDRMNETTAAKWERLGNQIEEMFVGPGTQSVLGDIADGLRVIVDLVSGPLNTAFWATSAAVLSIKSGLTSLPEAGGKVLDYLRESAYKAGEALREAAEKGEEMSKTANGVEQAADAVSDIGDALEDAQEAGEQAGEAVGAASGAITNMGGAARVSIFSINGLKMAWKGLDATMKANIIVAVIALLWTLGKALYDAMKATDAERDAVAKANQEADRAVEKLDNYFARLKETKEELDKVTKSTEDATDAEIKMTKAKENHRAAILNINKNYGQYLGFMLTEYDRAELVAAAHDKITAAIRREILMKAKQAAIEDTGKEYEEGLTKDWSAFSEELVGGKRLSSEQAAEAKLALKKFLPKSFTVGSDGKTLVASNELKKSLGGLYNENASLNELTAVWFARHLQQNYGLGREAIKDITGIDYYKSDYGTTKGQYAWTKSRGWSNLRGDYLDEYFEMQQKNAKTGNLYNDDINAETKNIEEQSSTLVKELKTNVQAQIALLKTGNLTTKETEDAYGELARSLEGINENVSGLTAAEQKTTEDTIKKILEQNKAVIDSKRLQKARENIQKSFDAFNTFDTGDNEKNPWGSSQPAESTDWKNMTAEQLVNRRKQMKDFVNAIQTDTDVQSVLKEDAALKKAIENGMSSDMRTVIEWYNTERLKIQDELHARHLTNTGDWMDPKKERGARKQFRDEMDAYLHELDAYYTERKTRIEEAGTDEGLTEAEIRNRTLNNEMEWQQRRAELQKLYSRKQKEVTKEELDAIYHIIAERTGDSESFVKAQIAKTNQFVDNIEKSGEKGAAIVHRWMSQVELDTERSYLKGQQALTKQMRAIEAIIDKERPFNGITKSLQESLSTMDILTGEMRKEYNELMKQGKDMTDFNNRQAQEEMKRTAFLLGEAENAYSTTIDRVMDDMRQKGMTAWADWLSADPKLQEALMAQLRSTYDAIQDAIKKEASQLKKQAEIMWNNILMPDGKTTLKQQTDRIVAQLGLDEGRVKRANSLIGAGQASERVADRLAIQQMKVQLAMQDHYYKLMKKQGQAHVDMLNAQAKAAKERGDEEEATRKTLDAQHAQMSLNLATAKEETELAKQREDIIARTEESQNRLYTELKSWADLLTSSLQGMMEASHAGDAEYYNEVAKLNLTGKGGPGAGTYIVIDNEGTEDATAHYEYLNERQALERQREIENDNAVAEAWEKMWDDINQKINDTITDQLNAMLQNKATEDNTAELQRLQQKLKDEQTKLDASATATDANTQAVQGLTQQLAQGIAINKDGETGGREFAADKQAGYPTAPKEAPSNIDFASDKQAGYPGQYSDQANTDATNANTVAMNNLTAALGGQPAEGTPGADMGSDFASDKMGGYPSGGEISPEIQKQIDESNLLTDTKIANKEKEVKTETEGNRKEQQSKQSMFAKMTAAANLYGIAYQAMSNDNLDMAQKFEMIALQAVGNAAIAGLQVALSQGTAETAAKMPAAAAESTAQAGPFAGPILFAALSALVGGLMGLAASKVGKAKSQISQVTGASVGAGRLSTGMLTYAEGNVNEFTDPDSLTPGRSYNVDGADGKTYRAKYMGSDPKTHITNGPEFHLVGEAGREAIIDAHTTRLMQMDDTGIWQAIQTLYNGGSLSAVRRSGARRGMRAFADGNLDEFDEMDDGGGLTAGTGMSPEQMAAFQQSLDRNSAIMERLEANGIKAYFDVYGKGGLVDSYDTGKKNVTRHGERY